MLQICIFHIHFCTPCCWVIFFLCSSNTGFIKLLIYKYDYDSLWILAINKGTIKLGIFKVNHKYVENVKAKCPTGYAMLSGHNNKDWLLSHVQLEGEKHDENTEEQLYEEGFSVGSAAQERKTHKQVICRKKNAIGGKLHFAFISCISLMSYRGPKPTPSQRVKEPL